MNLIQQFGPRDESSTPAGDLKLVGVDERSRPADVAPGFVSSARNMRFRAGKAETRAGIGLLPWMKGTGLTPFTDTYGGGVFSDPNQSGEWILIAADGGVWKTRPNRTATAVPLPPGVTLTAGTYKKFIQANAAILMLRGFGVDPLVCYDLEKGFEKIAKVDVWEVSFDHATNLVELEAHGFLVGDPIAFAETPAGVVPPEGTTGQLPPQITVGQTYYVGRVTDPDHFTVVTAGGTQVLWNNGSDDTAIDSGQVQALDGASEIPPAEYGIFWANRVYLIDSKDTLVQSDIGDFTRYAPVPDTFRINQGDAFNLLALRMMNESTMLFFKSGNVQKAVGVGSDIAEAEGPLNVTDEYGIAGADAHCQRGKDVYWLTNELRVSSIKLTDLNKEQEAPAHLSDTLPQTFGRIKAAAASGAKLTSFEEYLFCAMPVDDARLLSQTELIPAGAKFLGSGAYPVAVTPGKLYQWIQGATTDNLFTFQGSDAFEYQGSVEFIGSDTGLVILHGPPNADMSDSIREVLATDVCNAVAVYDFQQQAWCGTDESSAGVVCVRDWIKFSYGGRTRLGYIGADGWLHLYGEGFEDEVPETIRPYVDVLFEASHYDGDISNSFRAGDEESIDITSLADLQSFGTGGSVDTETIADGIRLTPPISQEPATMPTVFVNEVQVGDGWHNWALVDQVGPNIISPIGIETFVRLRGYACLRPGVLQSAVEAKRFVCLALQLATWSPSYTIRTMMQGNGSDEDEAADQTRDRLKYFDQFEKSDWDPANTNNDFNNAGREDYSWLEDGQGMVMGDGVDVDAHQEFVHRVPVNGRGLWMQAEISSTDGRLELLAAAMEAERGEVLAGVAIN